MNLCVRYYLRSNLSASFLKFASTTPEIEKNELATIDETDDILAREIEIEKMRNKSKLSEAHFNLVNGRRPYEVPRANAHLTVKYHRKMYGQYGASSGVNPSLCWPTKKEIAETQEYEAVAYPFTIKEMIETAAQKRKEEEFRIQQRDDDVSAKFLKLEQWKNELNAKIAKKEAEVQAAKLKKERLVEEVRRHFGFTLDPRDERFKEMLAKREKEQKKLEKLAKMEAKEKLMLAKLQQKNVELNEKS